MKKIIFLCMSVLGLLSCEQEKLLDVSNGGNLCDIPLTRGASDVKNPIEQLDGIPVYIKSVSNKTYMSSERSGSKIKLVYSDDGSLCQRWNVNIKYGNIYHAFITTIGGNSTFGRNGLITGSKRGDKYEPILTVNGGMTTVDVLNSGDGLTYNITALCEPNPIPFAPRTYLQPESTSSTSIIGGDSDYKGDLVKWEIIPVDEFRIDDITYDLTTSDRFSATPEHIAVRTMVNDTDYPATRTISFQETVTSESSFSSTEGLKVSVSTTASAKVGVGKFAEGSFSVGSSNEKSWTYTVGQKETKAFTISETFSQELPPRTRVKAELVAIKYDASLTYIAKMYGLNSGKTIYLKGKWNGVIVQESKIVLTQENNEVLKTIKVTPK